VRSRKKIFKPYRRTAIKTSSKEQVNHSEQFYRFLFEKNPFAAWIYDIESLKFLEVNPAAIEFYGYSKEEFTSMTLNDISVPGEMSSFKEAAGAPRGNETGNEHIWKHRKKNGDEVYVEVRARDFTYNHQRALLVMITDITAVINA
jgi:PAS domain S-box-containing protein